MSKINIGFDIDDTLTITEDFIFEMFKHWYTNIKKLGPYKGRYLREKYNYDDKFTDVTKEQKKEFNDWYFPFIIKDAPFREGTKELLTHLRNLNYAIHIVTRRDENYKGSYSGHQMKQDTLARFDECGIPVDEFHFSCFNKAEAMRKNNIVLLAEDQEQNILQVNREFPCIIMRNPWNKHMKANHKKHLYEISDLNIQGFLTILNDIQRS